MKRVEFVKVADNLWSLFHCGMLVAKFFFVQSCRQFGWVLVVISVIVNAERLIWFETF